MVNGVYVLFIYDPNDYTMRSCNCCYICKSLSISNDQCILKSRCHSLVVMLVPSWPRRVLPCTAAYVCGQSSALARFKAP